MKKVLLATAAAASFLAGISMANAQATVQLGVLQCDISAGVGLIFTQKQTMSCVYQPNNGGPVDNYTGNIEEFGLELGATSGGELTWVVLSAERGVPQGALAGTYVGLSANASVGAGVGANDLSGGFNRAFILQPYSVQTQTGVNFAAGVAKVTLRDVP